jgi:hypothetical protein
MSSPADSRRLASSSALKGLAPFLGFLPGLDSFRRSMGFLTIICLETAKLNMRWSTAISRAMLDPPRACLSATIFLCRSTLYFSIVLGSMALTGVWEFSKKEVKCRMV